MKQETLIRQIVLMVVLRFGTPVVINLKINGTIHRIEIA
jgi:hypothetical protein